MLVEETPPTGGNFKLGAAILLIGVAIGTLTDPGSWFASPTSTEELPEVGEASVLPATPTDLHQQFVQSDPPEEPRLPELMTLHLELPPESAAKLQEIYDRSWESGLIVQEAGDLVPATVRLGDKTVTAEVRIKGDYLDHLKEKWSFRVELKSDKLLGMSRFSIQHPAARQYLWEWLVMKAGRKLGLLAPRADYCEVILNGNNLGVYYLEEHFTKELIESQGRREGPIVKFDEGVAMNNEEQYGFQQFNTPETTRRATFITMAEVGAFGEKRLAQSENLARQLEEALDQMRAIQNGILLNEEHVSPSRLARLQGKIDLASTTIEDVLDIDLNTRYHALSALFRCKHGLAWKNRRFYHNPITGRLEPIVFDTRAGYPISERDPFAMATHTNNEFLRNKAYYNQLFISLSLVAAPDFLNELFEETEAQMRLYSAAMAKEGMTHRLADVEAIKNELWDQQIMIREVLRPREGVSFDTRLYNDANNSGDIIVEAWATTNVPVLVAGFQIQDASFLTARQSIEDASGCARIKSEPTALILPTDGRRVKFRFPGDARLATLLDVKEVKKAVLDRRESDKSLKLVVDAVYRYLGESENRSERLRMRRFGSEWTEEGGRPDPPTLQAALDQHEFLKHDPATDRLSIVPGEWDVDGDLVVPAGYDLHAGPGVSLSFDKGRALITDGALHFAGTAESPIRLAPNWPAENFGGVVVLEAPGQSTWKHVKVRDTDIVRRGGWMMTGGVTFFESPVTLEDCSFNNSHGEDALNIFRVAFELTRVVIDGVASDAFDGDFVTGTVRDCTIMNSVEDGVDVSGSDIDVIGCRFINVGDKGISAGEDSTVRVRDCVVESASIGAASKDFSRVEIDGFDVLECENYGFAVYIKKPEFGPSSIIAENVTLGLCGRGAGICQETCELVVNGERHEAVPIDVKEMYRQKILGK